MTDSQTFRGYSMRNYLAVRLERLSRVKPVEQVAREMGFRSAKPILSFATGETRVPLDMVLPLAQALGAPLLPFFSLAMAQYGLDMAELAGAICDRVVVNADSVDDFAKPRLEAPDDLSEISQAEFDAMGPMFVELTFDVSEDFRRQFFEEAFKAKISPSELLTRASRAYLETSQQPSGS